MTIKTLLPLNKHGNRRGMSPGSRANLSKPGETHNPNGGPPISLVSLLRQELAKVPLKGLDGKMNAEGYSNARLVIRRILEEALEGNTALLRDLIDRLDGKPVQAITGPGGGPLEVRQEMKIIGASDIRPALAALIECGAVSICSN